MISQSPILQDLNSTQQDYEKVMKQLKTNKLVRTVVENPETRNAFMSALTISGRRTGGKLLTANKMTFPIFIINYPN